MRGKTRAFQKFWCLVSVLFPLWCGLGPSQLWARGVQEDRMQQAQDLVNQKKYDEAFLLLVKVVREEPERLDEAEALLTEIRQIRKALNDKTESLTNELAKGNVDAAKALMTDVRALDPNPNPFQAAQIKQTNTTININYAKKTFVRIMDDGLARLKEKKYAEAAMIYLQGYDFMTDEYAEGNYGNIVYNLVASAKADMKAAATTFVAQEAALTALEATGLGLVTAGSGVRAGFGPLVSRMESLAELRRRIWAASELYRQQNLLLKTNSLGGTDEPHLNYDYLVTRGREKVTETEGLLGSLDRLYVANLTSWAQSLNQRLELAFGQAKTALDGRNLTQAQSLYTQIVDWAGAGLDVANLWNRLVYTGPTGLDAENLALTKTQLALAENFRTRYLIALEGLRIIALRQTADTLMAKTGQNRTQLEQDRQTIDAGRLEILDLGQRLQDRAATLQAVAAQGVGGLDGAALFTAYRASWRQYSDLAQADTVVLLDRRGSFDYTPLEARYQASLANREDIRKTLLDGVLRDEGDRQVISKYPSQALVRFATQVPQEQTLEKAVQDFIAAYLNEAPEIRAAAPVQKWIARGRELLTLIQTLRQETDRLVAKARDDQAAAQQSRLQSLRSADLVEAALTATNYLVARRNLADFTRLSNESLVLQEDLEFRRDRDNRFKDFGQRIQEGEGKLVIKEVRDFIETGKEFYNLGRFTQAEDSLLRARNRWSDTNVDPNPEVEFYYSQVKDALEGSTGVVVVSIDPLYNEMQQLLNFARGDYETAKTLQENGDSTGMTNFLTKASKNIDRVLTAFPRNQEARRLQLLVLQITNQTSFRQVFQTQLDSAKAKLEAATKQGLKELEDLKKIDPTFPGLAAAIQSFNDKINAPQINAQNQARARTLIARAQSIADNEQAGQYDTALNLLAEARTLDPNNRAIGRISDQILIAKAAATAQTVVVGQFDGAEEQLYSDAEALFAAGKAFEALQIVTRLFSSPKNRTIAKLKKLKSRLESAVN